MVHDLMENYQEVYEDDGYEYLDSELHFIVPLGMKHELEGYIDDIVEDDKGIAGMETKTYKKMPDRNFLVFNQQSGLYSYAMTELEIAEYPDFIWNIIKAKQPTKPQLTAGGKKKEPTLSTRKLDSTPLTVEKGIIELGYDPEDYQGFIDQHDYEGYFFRERVRNNMSVTKSIVTDAISTFNQMEKFGGMWRDKNLTRNCSFCDYRSICEAELLGLDTGFIIKKEYKPKEGRDGEKKKKTKGRTKKGNRGRSKVSRSNRNR